MAGIAGNLASIGTNANDIINLQSSDATQSADIAGNLASIGTNANDITNLQSSDATQSAAITGNLASIGTNTDDIQALDTKFTDVDTTLVSFHKHTYHISLYKTLPRIIPAF